MADIRFVGWRRKGGRSIDSIAGGRAVGKLGVKVHDTAGGSASGEPHYALHGPRDVAGLRAGAIAGRFPRPGQTDAEPAYCPYVTFRADDLPWRYTPEGPDGDDGMRPWLALVVVEPGQVEARPSPGLVRLGAAALGPNVPSHHSAHVQDSAGHVVSRVVCRRSLKADHEYLAFVVPAFRADGQAWDGTTAETLAVLDEWWFRAGDVGTFETLAKLLHPADDLGGFGRIEVALGDGADERVGVRGALTKIGDDTDPAPPGPAVDLLAEFLTVDPDAAVPGHQRGFDAAGRRYVRPPTYGEAWRLDVTDGAPAGGWIAALQTDPTHRVVAGLGLQAGVDLQDEIATAAADRFGGTEAANQRIAGLAAGLAASRSLWDRRLPTQRDRRIALLGLAAGRILATGDDGVTRPLLDLATGSDRTLPPAILSTAAIRVLRSGASRLRRTPGAAESILGAANRPRPTVRRPDEAPAGQRERYADGVANGDALVAAVLASGAAFEGPGGPARNGDEMIGAFVNADIDEEIGGGIRIIDILVHEPPRRRTPRPVDLDELDKGLLVAFDPRGRAAAVDRVRATIDPDDDPEPLAPREPCVDLDLPAWRYLRDRQPEWLLPGASTLGDGEVVGLSTNPLFVDAFLVGENTQALGEMRWRNLRPATGCTPLRRFWDRTADTGAGPTASSDIVGVGAWVIADGGGDRRGKRLGDVSHAAPGAVSTQLVVAFRTELFRRYPNTLVYLATPAPPTVPNEGQLGARIAPAFVAQASPTLWLFAFPVAPAEIANHWVVVEQQPPGIRFDRDLGAAAASAEAFADVALVQPVRVLLSGPALAAV